MIIGRAQLARFETDVEYCATNGVPIVRRFTGGGTVRHGPGNLNWSICVGRDFRAGSIRYAWDVPQVFAVAASIVVSAIKQCGGDVSFDRRANRIVSPEGKVSGMAAYLSKDAMFCHGTLLLDADLGEVTTLTHPSSETLARRYARSNPATVANLGIEERRVVEALAAVISQETGFSLADGGPSDGELHTMQTLLPRYRDDAWNLGDPFLVEPSKPAL